MNKVLVLLTAVTGLALTSSAFADDDVQKDQQAIHADIRAIHKDNVALAKDRDTLSQDRAAKADDKANDQTGKQAADSARIGAVQTTIGEKEAERKVDRETLEHDKKELNEDQAKAASQQ